MTSNSIDNDEWLSDDLPGGAVQPAQHPWRVLVVDDEPDIHAVTRLALNRIIFKGRGIEILSAYSAAEGFALLSTEPDIDANRRGLHRILEASSNLYHLNSLQELASGVLTQVGAILGFGAEGVLCVMRKSAGAVHQSPMVMAATQGLTQLPEQTLLPADHPWADLIGRTFRERRSQFTDQVDVLFIEAVHGHQFVVAFSPPWPLGEVERGLVTVFCDRIAAAFDNLHMFGQLKTTQEATVVALADLAESRDATTGGHVRRVCRLTDAIARELKAADKFASETTHTFMSFVGIASILHDVGKVATPDAVLLKPGRHTPQERKVMEEHAIIGETVLRRASDLVEGESTLSLGAQISGGHHEHFDGKGYPRGLKGHDIPLAARIVAVVDVFDALLHRRPYKEPWPLDQVLSYLQERRGTQFDPDVLDALVAFLGREQPDWIIDADH